MKVQKISITKTVKKCLLLIDQFKSEQKYVNSPLIKQTASDFDIAHKKLIQQLTELDQSMQKYMILSVQAATEISGGVLEQKILEQTAQMDKYCRMIKSIKDDNKEVFRESNKHFKHVTECRVRLSRCGYQLQRMLKTMRRTGDQPT